MASRGALVDGLAAGNSRYMGAFIFIYRAGPDPVPADRVAENRAAWQVWNAALQEDYGIRTAGGKLVSAAGVTETDGVVRGASMVEFDSMDDAVEVAQRSPNLAFGGSVEVLEELHAQGR
jgi:hypothetical protein